jgi:hypothetical protein
VCLISGKQVSLACRKDVIYRREEPDDQARQDEEFCPFVPYLVKMAGEFDDFRHCPAKVCGHDRAIDSSRS